MFKRLNWRIVALIAFVIAAGGFIYWNVSTVQQMKKQAALFEKMLEKEKEPVVAKEPPPAAPGKKWVPHGDHFHEVPIDAPDVWQGGAHESIAQPAQPAQPKKLYTGPLTFHEELLKTNPVKALRLQQEERGHWSAAWIPPFPPDDIEAQEFARAKYLTEYYWHTYGEKLDTPEYEREKKEISKARAISQQMRRTIRSYPYGARRCDLMKLTWPSLDSDPVTGGVRHPSEYFGNAEVRDLLKQAGTWKY